MKRIIAAAVALMLALSAHAQIGIIGGLTSSSTDYKTAFNEAKSISQYHLGLAWRIPLRLGFCLQPALIYNMKGSEIEDLTSGTGSIDYKTGFLELPVQVQWGVNLPLIRPYVFAEPFLGYAISNKAEGVNLSNDWENVKNRIECGLGLGVGVELFKRLQVSARYFWNLGTMYNADLSLSHVGDVVSGSKCNGIAASLAILF